MGRYKNNRLDYSCEFCGKKEYQSHKNSIKPKFIKYGTGRSEGKVTTNLKNIGSTALKLSIDPRTEESDFFTEQKFMERVEGEEAITVYSTPKPQEGTSSLDSLNIQFDIYYRDIDDNLYVQHVISSARGGNSFHVTEPAEINNTT